MTTSAAILNSLNPNSQSKRELGTELMHTTTHNREFSHDVTAAMLLFQSNETAAMLVDQTSPVGVELFPYVNTSFCFSKFACVLAT